MRLRYGALMLLIAAMLGVAGVLPAITAVEAQQSPEEFDIPNGRFYTQARGSYPAGFGFAVADDGIQFYTTLKQVGGPQVAGYPISQRFITNGRVAQAFQRLIMIWQTETGTAALQQTGQNLSLIPSDALVPGPYVGPQGGVPAAPLTQPIPPANQPQAPAQPYGAVPQQPYGQVPPQPYGQVPAQPYGQAPQQPYYGQPGQPAQPYAPQQPYYGPTQPYYGPQQPYYGQQQPYGQYPYVQPYYGVPYGTDPNGYYPYAPAPQGCDPYYNPYGCPYTAPYVAPTNTPVPNCDCDPDTPTPNPTFHPPTPTNTPHTPVPPTATPTVNATFHPPTPTVNPTFHPPTSTPVKSSSH